MRSRARTFWKSIGLLVVSILVTVSIVEMVLRVAHLATEIPWVEGHSELGHKYRPNQSGTYVVGRFGDIKATYHINSHGWNATRNYDQQREPGKKRIAFIGDSFVEALNVPPEAAVSAVLERRLSHLGSTEVYAFGISGASLAHYLAMMRHVRTRFSPDLYIINIVHNDFTESFPRKHRAMFHAVRQNRHSYEEVPAETYRPTLFRRMLGHLAIVRYLYSNLRVQNLDVGRSPWSRNSGRRFEANIDTTTMDIGEMRGIVKYIFEKCLEEAGSDRKRLVFVMDAPREPIYEGVLPQTASTFQYNKLTGDVCRDLSLQCLDLTDVFWRDFQENRRRFNAPIDGHWNEYGHEVAARAIENFLGVTTTALW